LASAEEVGHDRNAETGNEQSLPGSACALDGPAEHEEPRNRVSAEEVVVVITDVPPSKPKDQQRREQHECEEKRNSSLEATNGWHCH